MRREILVAVVAGGAALLLATGVVAGVLLSDDDDAGEQASVVVTVTATSQPAVTPSPAPPALATLAPNQVPPEINSLPAAIRDRVRDQFLRGEITREQIVQLVEQRSAAARAGIISAVEADKIEVRTYQGEDFTWEITADTAIRRINQPATASELQVGETVLILSRDGGKTAFSIESYGTLATLP